MRVFEASCSGGVVMVEGLAIESAIILSAGEGVSEGILIVQKDKAFYVASSAQNLEFTLDAIVQIQAKITEALTHITTALTAIGAGMTGPTTAPPPILPTEVAAVAANVVIITALGVQLEALKGTLI